VSAEPVAEPLVGFRRWGCKRGGLYSGIFVAGRFIPNPALGMVAPRVGQKPWPTDSDRVAKCYAVTRLRIAIAAEAYAIPLLERTELIAYARWHCELRMTRRSDERFEHGHDIVG